MRFASIIVLSLMLAAAQPLAQQKTKDDTTETLRKANRKITIGLALMGAGALGSLITVARRDGDSGPEANISIGMIFVGSGVAWWGATERHRARQPQTAIGVDVGRTLGFHLRRIW